LLITSMRHPPRPLNDQGRVNGYESGEFGQFAGMHESKARKPRYLSKPEGTWAVRGVAAMGFHKASPMPPRAKSSRRGRLTH
jgi:hypothetical protein